MSDHYGFNSDAALDFFISQRSLGYVTYGSIIKTCFRLVLQ